MHGKWPMCKVCLHQSWQKMKDCDPSNCDPRRCQNVTEPRRRVSTASSEGNQSSITSVHNDFVHKRSNDTSPSLDTTSANYRTDTKIRDTKTQDRTESVSSSNHFIWGESDSECFIPAIFSAYKKIVHWRRNIFMIPSGPSGKEFILKMTRLFTEFVERSCRPYCYRSPTTVLKQRTTSIA